MEPISADEDWICGKTPIVAWRINNEFAEAIAIDNVKRGDGRPPVVLAPDGSVTEPGNNTYDSIDEWIRSLEKRRKAAKEYAESASLREPDRESDARSRAASLSAPR